MPATTNKFEALAEAEGPATGGGKQCTDEELLAAVLAAKAAHPDYGLARLRTHIKDTHGWELSEKRVKKVLGGDGGGHAASAPPQEGSKTKREPPGPTRSGGGGSKATGTPPPWFDESVDPEFLGENESMVFQDEYRQLLLKMEKGEMSADEDLVKPEMRQYVKTGMTALQSAAAMADIPMMKAVLRLGARIDRFSGSGSVMQMLVGMMLMQGEMVKGNGPGADGVRSRLKAVEFLLSVGADPNAKPNESLGDVMSGSGPDQGKLTKP
jgi:hypothetical protein